MKHKKRENTNPFGIIRAPGYPHTAETIQTKLCAALEQQFRRKMTFKLLGQITGQLTSTTGYWWHHSLGPHLVALARLLEHIPASRRNELLSSVCRTCPTLDHPRLAHDLENLRILFDVIHTHTGLTQVVGGDDAARAFVVGALARAFFLVSKNTPDLAGLDLQRPPDFVPVPGLLYLDGNANPQSLRAQVKRIWPDLEVSISPYMIFNGVWSRVPEKRATLLAWARSRNIVLVEEAPIDSSLLPTRGSNAIKVLEVSTAKTHFGSITIAEKL